MHFKTGLAAAYVDGSSLAIPRIEWYVTKAVLNEVQTAVPFIDSCTAAIASLLHSISYITYLFSKSITFR